MAIIRPEDYGSLRIHRDTVARARALKIYRRETDDELVTRLCEIAEERERREDSRKQARKAS